ncbi:FecR family protein [Pseudomonas sp. CAN2814]|uniref:FecR family protein n=1 Tax=Pseudomonas sp. CAN1 TaxID=3046726 RepID=UPI0026490079|nr:FecR family protein [Pseudomonas sp. CAN1]MDN6860611.1 FecR family protein [Pseudomonas sp. CAN1]
MKDESILETAADWVLRLDESDCSASERQAFERWYASDERHRLAVDQMRGLIGQLHGLHNERQAAGLAIASTLASRQRRVPRALLGLGAVALGLSALLAVNGDWRQDLQADLHTTPGEWRRERLADDSVLLLAGNSAVKLHYDHGQRSVELLRGEVLVDVAPDPQRPFRVTTADGSMRALGTRFVVNLEAQDTQLSMLHSRVSAQSADGSRTQEVAAGEQVRITRDDVQSLGRIDPASVDQAWQRHQLAVRDAPLGEVLDQLARQQRGYWSYGDPALNRLRISAVLPLDDSARALALIEEILPVKVRRFTPWLVRISAEPNQE